MRVAICYRGHYFRNNRKKSNFFLCYENHLTNLLNGLDYDIYFHSHSNNCEMDDKLLQLLKPKKYAFQSTKYISDSFVMSSRQVLNKEQYDLIINLRFDLWFKVSLNNFLLDINKFNFLWEENIHYRTQLGYRKVTDLLFAMPPKYVEAFETACEESKFSGGISGTGHHLYPFIENHIGENNINFMLKEHYDSNTDNKNNKYLEINRNI